MPTIRHLSIPLRRSGIFNRCAKQYREKISRFSFKNGCMATGSRIIIIRGHGNRRAIHPSLYLLSCKRILELLLRFILCLSIFALLAAGTNKTYTVFNNLEQQIFIIHCPLKPSAVSLDPENWILKYSSDENELPPSTYALEQNYPNPFNSTTTIAYQIPKREQVLLTIYDVLGREVATLVDAKQFSGIYEYQWNPQNMASGIYFYRLNTGSVQLQRKMVLLK
jgi:hypothetical protein